MKLSVLKDGGNEPLSEIVRDRENERKHEAAWRANQLEIVGAITIPLVLANLINASVVWLSFHDTSAGVYLSVWISAVAIICAAAVLANKVRRFRHRGLATSRRLLKEYTIAAAIAGLLWAAVPIMVMNVTDSYGQMILGVILAGTMFTGACLLYTSPSPRDS